MRSRRWRCEEVWEIDRVMFLALVMRDLLREVAEKALRWDDRGFRFCWLEGRASSAMFRAKFWRLPEVALNNGKGAIF